MKVLKYIFPIAAVMTISGIATGGWANSVGDISFQGRVLRDDRVIFITAGTIYAK